MNEQKPQPWHEADEKPQDKARSKGAPIGTHSLTGGGAAVGMPTKGTEDVERGNHREGPPEAEEPDPMLEPRAQAQAQAQAGDMLGTRKG